MLKVIEEIYFAQKITMVYMHAIHSIAYMYIMVIICA